MVRIVNGNIVAEGTPIPGPPSSSSSSSSQSITARATQPVSLCGYSVPAYSLGLLGVLVLVLWGIPGLIIFGIGVGGSYFYSQLQQQAPPNSGSRRPGGMPGFGRGQIRGVSDLPRPPPSS